MPTLHYGPWLQISLSESEARQVEEASGAHATRGGWVAITDTDGRPWSLLISAGIPMWMTHHEESAPPGRADRRAEDHAMSKSKQGREIRKPKQAPKPKEAKTGTDASRLDRQSKLPHQR